MERKPVRGAKSEGPIGRAERKEGDRPEWQKRVERVKDVEKSPLIPSEITSEDLDMSVRVQLKTLTAENAEMVARHLAMVSLLIDDDPELAHKHALAASRRAGRLAVVHETLGITAYQTGDFALALRELLTHRRLSASNDQIPLIVDSERGLGRPEKALDAARGVDRSTLPVGVRINLAITISGARLDLGQVKEARQELEIPELSPKSIYPQSPLLFRSYAEVLRELGKDGSEWDELADRADEALATHGGEVFNLVEEINIPTSEDFERGKQARIEKSQKYGDRKPRFDRPRRGGEDRPKRQYSDRPRKDGEERPRREFSDRPRRDSEDRPRRDTSDRPRRDSEGRPRREFSDRPGRDGEDRPRREGGYRPRNEGGEQRPRRDGEFRSRREGEYRPRREEESGESRPRREGGYKPRGAGSDFGSRPRRTEGSAGDKPRGERKYGERISNDRPERKYSDRPRPGGRDYNSRGNRGKAD